MALFEELTSIDPQRFRAVAESLLSQMVQEVHDDDNEDQQLERDRQYPALEELVVCLGSQLRMQEEDRDTFVSGACFALATLMSYAEAEKTQTSLAPGE